MGVIILVIVLVMLFGGGCGYWGGNRWGMGGGFGIGIGGILLILLVCYLLGMFPAGCQSIGSHHYRW
jgi:hypothetical protein